MLQSLIIENFRTHEHTKIEFTPGINAIIGRSNHGKTNILRALLLLATNRPSGYRYHSRFAGDKPTSITATTSDSHTVRLVKTKSKATYILDSKEYTGFNKDVPDLVAKALNIGPSNIQSQLDPHYLISKTPGEIGKEINRITGIDEADRWITELTSTINKHNQELKINSESKSTKEKSLAQYEGLEGIEKYLDEIDAIDLELDKLLADKSRLEELLDEFASVNQSLELKKEVEKIEEQLTIANECIDLIDEYTQLLSAIDKVFEINVSISETKVTRDEVIEEYIEKLKQEKLCPLCLSNVTEKQIKIIKESI